MKHTHLVKSKKMLNHFTLIYIFATLLHCVCTLYSTVLYIYIIQYILVCFSYNINLVLFLLSVGISLPESRSRLYQGSRSRSDNFVCKSTPPLFQTPQPRIDEIDISPLPLTSDRRGWGFPPLEIDFFTPRLDFLPPFTPDRLRLILPPLPRKWHIGSEKFRSISLVFPRPPGPAWDLDFGSLQLYLLGVGGWVSKN